MNPWLLAWGMLSAGLWALVDVAELLSLNLKNLSVEKSCWKIGFQQVSFGFIQRKKKCAFLNYRGLSLTSIQGKILAQFPYTMAYKYSEKEGANSARAHWEQPCQRNPISYWQRYHTGRAEKQERNRECRLQRRFDECSPDTLEGKTGEESPDQTTVAQTTASGKLASNVIRKWAIYGSWDVLTQYFLQISYTSQCQNC